jgi:Zinc finger, C2H2 type
LHTSLHRVSTSGSLISEHRTTMAGRPSMNARDSSGRKVSLLNEEPTSQNAQLDILPYRSPPSQYEYSSMIRSHSNTSELSDPASPSTPGLVRADSFDSQNTQDPRSPITPVFLNDLGRNTSYTSAGYKDQAHFDYRDRTAGFEECSSNGQYQLFRPSYADSRSSSYAESQMYDEESYQNGGTSERGQKRYPCRFRESMGCEKTFTTSGHASRHSKIHTAEKGVSCSWPGCQKKFTRADNMKQHLETHTKDRSRPTPAHKSTLKSTLTVHSGVKKPSAVLSRPSRSPSRNAIPAEGSPLVDPALYSTSPASLTSSFQGRPITARGEVSQSGLDALAMAADYQTKS